MANHHQNQASSKSGPLSNAEVCCLLLSNCPLAPPPLTHIPLNYPNTELTQTSSSPRHTRRSPASGLKSLPTLTLDSPPPLTPSTPTAIIKTNNTPPPTTIQTFQRQWTAGSPSPHKTVLSTPSPTSKPNLWDRASANLLKEERGWSEVMAGARDMRKIIGVWRGMSSLRGGPDGLIKGWKEKD
ncbi:hypothetical protein ACEPPN_010106 [Leptodophora sp. 'Broadleaf-Isolate-01']